jgi:nucleoside-diphosphate-sugar epimerase
MKERLEAYKKATGRELRFYEGDLQEPSFTDLVIGKEKPDCIVHFGEIPSAPYSMIDLYHCNYTQMNNIIGTNNIMFAMKNHAPECHLLKLGTMGEYGTPNVDIPEGFFEVEYRGRKDTLPFPRQPGSWYHLTKVHDSANIIFACKIWKLRSTDIMQGVVHGVVTDDMVNDDLLTRFDFDEVWGTALNRFCAQAIIGHELTPYGRGGQTRGYLALRDSMQCLTIAIENPPDEGEYRVFNQFDECHSVNELAEYVVKVSKEYGLDAKIWNIENPRLEMEDHYYNPDRKRLPDLGFKPTNTLEDELRVTIPKLMEYRDRIEAKRQCIMPKVKWTA